MGFFTWLTVVPGSIKDWSRRTSQYGQTGEGRDSVWQHEGVCIPRSCAQEPTEATGVFIHFIIWILRKQSWNAFSPTCLIKIVLAVLPRILANFSQLCEGHLSNYFTLSIAEIQICRSICSHTTSTHKIPDNHNDIEGRRATVVSLWSNSSSVFPVIHDWLSLQSPNWFCFILLYHNFQIISRFCSRGKTDSQPTCKAWNIIFKKDRLEN